MRKTLKKPAAVLSAVLASVLLLTALGGCGRRGAAPEPAEPAAEDKPADQAVTAELPSAETAPGRQDGERFEEVIILEGMEETVRYEHVRNAALGFEIDYDYESFLRRSEPDRECFISVYDIPENPENYLELTFRPEDAETVSASVSEVLSEDYDLIRETYLLDHAGSCIRIDASCAKGNGGTPDLLQMVYIIPADGGSIIGTAHYSFESAEGFGRRFAYIMNTLTVIERTGV